MLRAHFTAHSSVYVTLRSVYRSPSSPLFLSLTNHTLPVNCWSLLHLTLLREVILVLERSIAQFVIACVCAFVGIRKEWPSLEQKCLLQSVFVCRALICVWDIVLREAAGMRQVYWESERARGRESEREVNLLHHSSWHRLEVGEIEKDRKVSEEEEEEEERARKNVSLACPVSFILATGSRSH